MIAVFILTCFDLSVNITAPSPPFHERTSVGSVTVPREERPALDLIISPDAAAEWLIGSVISGLGRQLQFRS